MVPFNSRFMKFAQHLAEHFHDSNHIKLIENQLIGARRVGGLKKLEELDELPTAMSISDERLQNQCRPTG